MSPRCCGLKAYGEGGHELCLKPTSTRCKTWANGSHSLSTALASATLGRSGKRSQCLCGRGGGGGSGRAVSSENPVASHLGWVPPGLPEAGTSCSVVIMFLSVLLLALFRKPHGLCWPVSDLLGSGLATKVAT